MRWLAYVVHSLRSFWQNPACNHVYKDLRFYECTARQTSGSCDCHDNPDVFRDPFHHESQNGHYEYLNFVQTIDMCETCRADPSKRRVTDEHSKKDDKDHMDD